MKAGFTGTRKGMTYRQRQQLLTFIKNTRLTEFHHGDCVGADEEAHYIAITIRGELQRAVITWPWPLLIYLHPPKYQYKRAYCKDYDGIYPPLTYLKRNQKIVDATDFLIAAPEAIKEQKRSGTWATIRYAQKQKKPILFLVP